MAIANFIDKISLSASQVLQGYDRKEFEETLLSQRITIFFDGSAVTHEGKACLDLLVRLIARLYPVINIIGSGNDDLQEELKIIARKINPVIELEIFEDPTACLVVGNTKYKKDVKSFYPGSEGWTAKFSTSTPTGNSSSENPFGAGAAACIAAANLFRYVFEKYLPNAAIDKDFNLSLLDYTISSQCARLPIPSLYFEEILLVGIGAIGNSLLWTLKRLPGLTGTLSVIDAESISLTNLQRYCLSDQDSIDTPKVNFAKQYLHGSAITVEPEEMNWGDYIYKRKNWDIDTIAICVDNAGDRMIVQGALPKKIFNAWTQLENLGVSRHTHFINMPCLCCLYYPAHPKKSRSQEIADILNISASEPVIRNYLVNKKRVDQHIISLICAANNFQVNDLLSFIGKSMDAFYSEFLCGGTYLKMKGTIPGKAQNMEVPSAFESAFAGILLAAELIKDKMGYVISKAKHTAQFNLMRPMTNYINTPQEKNPQCICNDFVYQTVYKNKWETVESAISQASTH